MTLHHHNAQCTIALHGAHIVSYQRDGKERLFLSKQAILDGSKPIRGGIPICWPWFGQLHPTIDEHRIAHGLVRNQSWRVLAQTHSDAGASVTLCPTNTTHPLWPQGLDCLIKITLSKTLEIRLLTTNRSAVPISYTGALHSYFAVSDVAQVHLSGFETPHDVIDNASGVQYRFTDAPHRIAGEYDRIHQLAAATTHIHDTSTITIHHQGHDSLVVWNPGPEKAKALHDLADAEYRQFVCIETAITQGNTLAPGMQQEMIQTIA